MHSTVWSFCRNETIELLTFLRHPRRRVRHAGTTAQQMRRLLWMLLLGVVLSVVMMFPLEGLVAQLAPSVQSLMVFNGRFVFTAVIMAPLLEEVLFRAGLRNAAYTLFIGPCLIVLVIFHLSWTTGTFAGVTALIGLLDHLRRKRPGLLQRRGRAFLRLYPAVFRAYGVAFAAIHLANYQASGWDAMLVPVLLLPQMLLGLLLSYIRLRQGLVHSMLLHSLLNAVFCLFEYLSKYMA